MNEQRKTELKKLALSAKKQIIIGTNRAKSGHPGGSLSCTEILTYLYFDKMNINPANPGKADRDRFVLSKGHAAPALYAVLALRGFFPMEDMHIFSPSFFLQEYTENMDQTLHQLRMQYPTLSWQSYTQVKANSAKAIRERFIMIRVMILILLVLAGAGWLIAAKNMILDRKEEYLILRKIGMTERKVSGIIWRQILPFLFIGIVLGAFAGSLLITYLGYLNYKTWNYRFSLDSIWFIVGYMIIMGMMLIPVIRKVCKLRCPHKIKHKETLREHLG